MLSLCKKTSLFPSTGPSRIYILFWAFLFFGISVGYGQVTVEFSQATGSDAENIGGNLPVLLVTGDVLIPTTVTVTDPGTGTATSAVDYDFTSPQVVDIPIGSYLPGSSIPIPTLVITGDATVELDETLDLALGAATGDAVLGVQTTTTYTINNDDLDAISITDVTQSEGNAGTTNFNFTVSVDGGGNAASNIDFDFTTVDGTATIADGDYVLNSGTGQITAGTPSTTITVQVNGDTTLEPNEGFTVELSNPVNATITDNVGDGTINNDDLDAISISDVTQSEGNAGTTNFNFTVSVDGGGNAASNIDFDFTTVDGTATIADGDYVLNSGTGQITAGTPSTTITVQVNGDTTLEPNEGFTVELSNPVNATITDNIGDGTINNDDLDAISISDVTQSEGNAGTTNFNFTVSVDGGGNAASNIDFDFTTVDGTATIADGDYVLNSGTGQITAGTPSTTITVQVNGDTTLEPNEGFTVELSNPVNATITDNVGDGTINNDDSATLTITNESVAEDVVGGNMVFTVTLDNAVAGGTQVAYSFTNGTAGGTDYANTPNTLNFVGNTSETQDITVAITDDTIIELDETFTVNLGPPTNGVTVSGSPATGTILNDDTAVATITASDDTAEEQGLDPGAFTVNIGGVNNTGSPITVDYNVGGTATPGSDYATLSGSVSIINGQQNGIIPVTPLNDSEVEVDETVIVTLVAGTGYTVGAPNTDTVTLVSEDNTPPDGYTLTINQDPINITNETAVSFTMTNIPAFSLNYSFSFSSSGDGNVSTVTGGGAILGLIGGTRSNLDISSLPDGVITLSVVVSNILGTEGPPTTDTAVKYTAVPSGYTATIDQSIINFDNQTSINFTFAGAEVGADYNYTFTSDGGGTPVNGTGTIATPTDNIANIDLSSLADGLVTLSVTLENINGTGAVVQDTSDKDTSVCNAGGGAPVLDATEPTVFCGDFLVDLNDYVTNVAPVGSTLTWSTNPDPNQTDGHRNSMVSSAAQYFGFFYDDVNACASPILTVTLTNFPIPVIIDPTGDERCGEGTLTLTASSDSGVLSWYDVPTGGTALDTGGVFITPSISETTSFYVEATANGCTTERIEVIATVLDAPSPGTATDVVACNSESEDGPNTIDLDDTLSGADAGTWAVITDPSNGSVAIGAGNVVNFTDLAIGDYVFEYTTTVTAGPCENSSVQVTVTVEDCFANADIDLVLTKEVDNANPLLDDVITFTITLENTTMDRILDIVVTDVLDEAFEYIGDDASVGTYDPNTGEWTIADLASDVATATLEITVRVTELGTFQNTAVLTSSLPVDEVINNNTATVSVTVGRDQCTDPGTLCTIFSPNNDGINDRLKFVDPNDDYTNNRLEIFDRYGNSVFAMDGYDSSWDGTGKNGAVPKGTYFYILDLHGDGAEVIKGWIQIIR